MEKVTKKVRERFTKLDLPKDIEYIYPIITILGRNKGFCGAEVKSADNIARASGNWIDLCNFKFMRFCIQLMF